ncbi:hypothetical protein AOLI_G00208580 [Acnodon oligacanthus]
MLDSPTLRRIWEALKVHGRLSEKRSAPYLFHCKDPLGTQQGYPHDPSKCCSKGTSVVAPEMTHPDAVWGSSPHQLLQDVLNEEHPLF